MEKLEAVKRAMKMLSDYDEMTNTVKRDKAFAAHNEDLYNEALAAHNEIDDVRQALCDVYAALNMLK